jgi:hypothetical protein
MKLILPAALLAVTLSLCNLTEKFKGTNSNQSNVGSSANTNTANGNSQANNDTVLKELTELENKWKAAKAKGDTATLQEVFADEFINEDEKGKTYNKAEWISVLKRGEPTLKSWTISDTNLVNFSGETATMTLNIHRAYKNGRDSRVLDTDKFVKRDGRWQVVSSQSTLSK